MGELLPTATAAAVGEALPCLRCGYDLRGAVGERCSECGWEIDPGLSQGGWFPWERRRYRGRFLTYLKTVWQVSVGSKQLAPAAERTHALSDAKAFARITGMIVAMVLAGLFFLVMKDEGLRRLAIEPKPNWPPEPPWAVWVENVAIPWSAAATLLPVFPLMLAGLAFYAVQASTRLFPARSVDGEPSQSAKAIGCYATGPLAWLLPIAILIALFSRADGAAIDESAVVFFLTAAVAVALLGLVWRVMRAVTRTKGNVWFMPAMLFLATLLYLLALGVSILREHDVRLRFESTAMLWIAAAAVLPITILRVVQWAGRCRRSINRLLPFGNAVYLTAIWLEGVVLFLGILPWCIGFIWLVIDSFR